MHAVTDRRHRPGLSIIDRRGTLARVQTSGRGDISGRHRGPVRWWLAHGTEFSAAAGLLGVVLGYLGYRALDPPLPPWDAAYSALQLLVLNGGTAPEGATTPSLLNLGRYVSAVAFGSTFMLVMARISASRADLLRSRWTRDHRVVIGSTLEAIQVVAAYPNEPTFRQRRTCRSVLVGRVDDRSLNELRSNGVAVIADADGTATARALRGASEIVVLEEHDVDGLARLHRLRTGGVDERTRVRIVLRSSELTHTVRHRMPELMGSQRSSVVSLPEVVARRLVHLDRHPIVFSNDRALVAVAGDGDVAAEIALAAVLPRIHYDDALNTRHVELHLVGVDGAPWTDLVASRLGGLIEGERPKVALRVARVAGNGAAYGEAVVAACGEPGSCAIYVAGLPDAQAVVVAAQLATVRGGGPRVVLLELDSLARDLATTGSAIAPGVSIEAVGALIDDSRSVSVGRSELLAAELRGRSAHDDALRTLISTPLGVVHEASSEAFAVVLLDALDAAGFVAVPTEHRHDVGRLTDATYRSVAREVASRCSLTRDDGTLRAHVFRIAQGLPDVLAAIGFELRSKEGNRS